jgi:hypothetical protein
VAKRIAVLNTAIGRPADASIAAADRARVRTQVAREFFLAAHGREPMDARELAGTAVLPVNGQKPPWCNRPCKGFVRSLAEI